MSENLRRRSPDQAFDFESDYGSAYEELAHQLIPAYAQLFQLSIALLEPRVGEEADVLVVGCGTGVELVTFGTLKPGWRQVGVDPSPQMIDLAKTKLEQHGLADRFQLVTGYTEDLPENSAFDVATLFNVMHFLPDDGAKLGLLESVATRLRPGGHFVMVDLYGDSSTSEFQYLLEVWKRYMLVRGLSPEEREVFLERLGTGCHFVPKARILELLAEAGFDDVIQFYRGLLYGGWIARKT